MKSLVVMMVVFTSTLSAQINSNQNNLVMENTDNSQIKSLLFHYRDALNESNAEAALNLYTEDGVFMPSAAPTAIGQEQVLKAYQFVFENIQLSIEFFIDEIEVIGDYAFVRSTSRGTVLIKAANEEVAEENRELFVLKKLQGSWKIDRYMFNKMQ